MADIMLRTHAQSQVTCVSNAFIDKYMKDASGEYVKVYLFLLRCLGKEDCVFSTEDIADALDYTGKDVIRALSYWEKVDLLRLEFDATGELIGICLLNPTDKDYMPKPQAAPAVIQENIIEKPMVSATMPEPQVKGEPELVRTSYSPSQIQEFKKDSSIQELIVVTEAFIAHPMSRTEMDSLLFWHDQLGMSIELIEYMVEKCVNDGHSSFHYMNKVALNWKDEGIATIAQAEAASNIHSQANYVVVRAFGLSGRNLNDAELDYVAKWTKDYGFSLDIVKEACQRTIAKTDRASFEYADSILTSWREHNIQNMEDIQKLDAEFAAKKAAGKIANPSARSNTKNGFTNYQNQRTYDYDALEKQLFGR